MDKPTCPDELKNEIVIIDLTKNSNADDTIFTPYAVVTSEAVVTPDAVVTPENNVAPNEVVPGDEFASCPETGSLHRGLELATQYLQKSIKDSTRTQVNYY